VKDFHVSLIKALEAIGEFSNAEKHVNELIHRANFRFSDL
jgi:DNA-binding SARP family transcriptional activator